MPRGVVATPLLPPALATRASRPGVKARAKRWPQLECRCWSHKAAGVGERGVPAGEVEVAEDRGRQDGLDSERPLNSSQIPRAVNESAFAGWTGVLSAGSLKEIPRCVVKLRGDDEECDVGLAEVESPNAPPLPLPLKSIGPRARRPSDGVVP